MCLLNPENRSQACYPVQQGISISRALTSRTQGCCCKARPELWLHWECHLEWHLGKNKREMGEKTDPRTATVFPFFCAGRACHLHSYVCEGNVEHVFVCRLDSWGTWVLEQTAAVFVQLWEILVQLTGNNSARWHSLCLTLCACNSTAASAVLGRVNAIPLVLSRCSHYTSSNTICPPQPHLNWVC